MLRRHLKPVTALRCHDARHRLTQHTPRRASDLLARHRCRRTVSKATCRLLGKAKIAPSTTTPATKSLRRSSFRRRPRQSAHLRPKPLHPQIPIVVNRPTQRPAGSFLGGFRTPTLRARANSSTGRHPKPFTEAVLQNARYRRTRWLKQRTPRSTDAAELPSPGRLRCSKCCRAQGYWRAGWT